MTIRIVGIEAAPGEFPPHLSVNNSAFIRVTPATIDSVSHATTSQAETLVRRLNIPYVTELLSKSVLAEDDTLFAGVFDGQASSAEVQSLATDDRPARECHPRQRALLPIGGG